MIFKNKFDKHQHASKAVAGSIRLLSHDTNYILYISQKLRVVHWGGSPVGPFNEEKKSAETSRCHFILNGRILNSEPFSLKGTLTISFAFLITPSW